MGEPTDVMRRKVAAFNAHDAAALGAVFSPDVHKEVNGMVLHGSNQVVAYFSVLWEAFPDLQLTTEGVVEAGSVVATRGRAHGTHLGTLPTPAGNVPPTGRSVALTFADDYDVRDGVIVRSHLHFDQLTMLEQLGLAPAPASA
jgi:predicted ester cyclase